MELEKKVEGFYPLYKASTTINKYNKLNNKVKKNMHKLDTRLKISRDMIFDLNVAKIIGLNYAIRKMNISLPDWYRYHLLGISEKTYYRYKKSAGKFKFTKEMVYTYIDGTIFFKGLSKYALNSYLILCYFKNQEKNKAYPSYKFIRNKFKIAHKTFVKGYKELEKNNIIKIGRDKKNYVYFFK